MQRCGVAVRDVECDEGYRSRLRGKGKGKGIIWGGGWEAARLVVLGWNGMITLAVANVRECRVREGGV